MKRVQNGTLSFLIVSTIRSYFYNYWHIELISSIPGLFALGVIILCVFFIVFTPNLKTVILPFLIGVGSFTYLRLRAISLKMNDPIYNVLNREDARKIVVNFSTKEIKIKKLQEYIEKGNHFLVKEVLRSLKKKDYKSIKYGNYDVARYAILHTHDYETLNAIMRNKKTDIYKKYRGNIFNSWNGFRSIDLKEFAKINGNKVAMDVVSFEIFRRNKKK